MAAAHCDAVAIDWGWPQLFTVGLGMEDTPGTNPHCALAHFTNGIRAATTFARQLTAAGLGDGGAAWTPFLSDCQNLPPRFATAVKARCGMTRDIGDPRIRLLSR